MPLSAKVEAVVVNTARSAVDIGNVSCVRSFLYAFIAFELLLAKLFHEVHLVSELFQYWGKHCTMLSIHWMQRILLVTVECTMPFGWQNIVITLTATTIWEPTFTVIG